jgi:hypothetical protein
MEELGGTLLFLAIIVAPIVLGVLLAYGILQRRRRGRMSAVSHDAAPPAAGANRRTQAGRGPDAP